MSQARTPLNMDADKWADACIFICFINVMLAIHLQKAAVTIVFYM